MVVKIKFIVLGVETNSRSHFAMIHLKRIETNNGYTLDCMLSLTKKELEEFDSKIEKGTLLTMILMS